MIGLVKHRVQVNCGNGTEGALWPHAGLQGIQLKSPEPRAQVGVRHQLCQFHCLPAVGPRAVTSPTGPPFFHFRRADNSLKRVEEFSVHQLV